MKKNSYIPTFSNDAEAANFFDTHDSTEYLGQTKPAKLSFPHPTHKVVVDLAEKQWQKLLKISSSRKIPYTRTLERLIARQLSAR